jgi:hypothetical protein
MALPFSPSVHSRTPAQPTGVLLRLELAKSSRRMAPAGRQGCRLPPRPRGAGCEALVRLPGLFYCRCLGAGRKSALMTDRLLPWFACMLLVFAAASDTATAQGSAAPSTIFAKPASQVVMVTGRPGTRNYEPDDVGAATLAKHDASSSAETPEAWQQRLEECMASWDNKTHITKDDWRKICIRELDDE